MRNVFLLCYDVADAKRLRRTYRKMRGFGVSVQYSIFRCEASPTEKQILQESLWEIMNWEHDRVMVIDLGPVGGGLSPRSCPGGGPLFIVRKWKRFRVGLGESSQPPGRDSASR